MLYYIIFAILGYLSGSILYARLFGYLFKKKDIIAETKDGNPGTANAFMKGGLVCGILTLCCELSKAFFPVFLCRGCQDKLWAIELMAASGISTGKGQILCFAGEILVLSTPVVGHIFPLFFRFRGGKGIAATFGSLLGLAPNLLPALTLAFFFLLFSLVIRITPHFSRTVGTYLFGTAAICVEPLVLSVKLAFVLIAVLVCWRMYQSEEEREVCRVRLLWMR